MNRCTVPGNEIMPRHIAAKKVQIVTLQEEGLFAGGFDGLFVTVLGVCCFGFIERGLILCC
jgi:hypothetical protein